MNRRQALALLAKENAVTGSARPVSDPDRALTQITDATGSAAAQIGPVTPTRRRRGVAEPGRPSPGGR